MPLMAGTIHPPHLSKSLRFFCVANSIKHHPLNPTTKSLSPLSAKPEHKPWSKDQKSPFIPQRHSIKHLPSNVKNNSNTIKTQPKQNNRPFNNKYQQNSKTRPYSTQQKSSMSMKARRQEYRDSPVGLLRRDLDQCSKHGDTARALKLYDNALKLGTPLALQHYNRLFYLCALAASPSTDSDVSKPAPSTDVSKEKAIKRGFEIYKRMCKDKEIVPDEATYTALARLAAAKQDPHTAFDLVKRMVEGGIPPKLRSFSPALHGFCEMGLADQAHEVESQMDSHGVVLEEEELVALLKLNITKGNGDHVYRLLHKIRPLIRQVSESTGEIIRSWFESATSSSVGSASWNPELIKREALRRGGGWHGTGWLGTGKWTVETSEMDEHGTCIKCKEKLVCIDIDPIETEAFRKSLTTLPEFKKAKESFFQFKKWLEENGPFDAVIDAANVGLCNQRDFSFNQVMHVVGKMKELSSSKKMPLIILHERRINDRIAKLPQNKMIIDRWSKTGALYATPPGSNDDWYWLYAAVSNKCLLVTNDEMRDHLFQLLGTSFFPRWKEKHQARISFSRGGPKLHMPPPYSIVIQESEKGRWHVPTTKGDDMETPRQWICANRENHIKIDTDNVINEIDVKIDLMASKPLPKLNKMSW